MRLRVSTPLSEKLVKSIGDVIEDPVTCVSLAIFGRESRRNLGSVRQHGEAVDDIGDRPMWQVVDERLESIVRGIGYARLAPDPADELRDAGTIEADISDGHALLAYGPFAAGEVDLDDRR